MYKYTFTKINQVEQLFRYFPNIIVNDHACLQINMKPQWLSLTIEIESFTNILFLLVKSVYFVHFICSANWLFDTKI